MKKRFILKDFLTMFDDIVWKPEASYGLLILNWVLTLSSALSVGLIISYIKSKTPAQKTIMDFVTKFFLALLLGSCLVSSVIVTTLTHLSNSGETIATALSWTMFNGSIRKNWSWTNSVGSCEKVYIKNQWGRREIKKKMNFPLSQLIFYVLLSRKILRSSSKTNFSLYSH